MYLHTNLEVIGAAEAARSGVLLGDDGEDLEERRQEPALVDPPPVVGHDLLGPQLTLLVLELPDTGATGQVKWGQKKFWEYLIFDFFQFKN